MTKAVIRISGRLIQEGGDEDGAAAGTAGRGCQAGKGHPGEAGSNCRGGLSVHKRKSGKEAGPKIPPGFPQGLGVS